MIEVTVTLPQVNPILVRFKKLKGHENYAEKFKS
jgi:hypothetical protein